MKLSFASLTWVEAWNDLTLMTQEFVEIESLYLSLEILHANTVWILLSVFPFFRNVSSAVHLRRVFSA